MSCTVLKLKNLQRLTSDSNAKQLFTKFCRNGSSGQDADFHNAKPFQRLSTQVKQRNEVTTVRRQSNHPKFADEPSVSSVNRQRNINQDVLESVDLSPLDDVYKDSTYTRSVENYIGTVKVPIGTVNVNVNGMYARGSFTVPLATTESALVASYSRGCKLINVSGGLNTAILGKTITRSPEFVFGSLSEAYKFLEWFNQPEVFKALKTAAESTTNHGKLIKTVGSIHGNKVLVHFMYETGNASGQNISTFATNAAISHILPESPVVPDRWLLETGCSQDKKATVGLFNNPRGVYVTSDIVCPAEAVEEIMKTSVEDMNSLCESTTAMLHMQGSAGLTCHTPNALAAIFIACGQDPACVAESHVGITEFRRTPENDLRVRVTIPSLMVGTVGGGTSLPSQKTCLDILKLPTENSRLAFAEVIMGVVVGGELSLAAAMTAHQFSAAHHKYARTGHGSSHKA